MGSILGLSDAALSVSRTVAPTLAGAAMSYGHLDGIMGLCVGTSLLAMAPLMFVLGRAPPLHATPVQTAEAVPVEKKKAQ